jgi:hypothetical protein
VRTWNLMEYFVLLVTRWWSSWYVYMFLCSFIPLYLPVTYHILWLIPCFLGFATPS